MPEVATQPQVGGYVLSDGPVPDPVPDLLAALTHLRVVSLLVSKHPYLPLGGVLHDLREAERGLKDQLRQF